MKRWKRPARSWNSPSSLWSKENDMIRVGTYNTGDFSGENVPAGSEKAKEAFREVMNAEGVALWALQEDVGFFDPETGEMPYEAIYSSYKNYKRSGEKKYNFKAFLTDLPISEAERIYYTGAPKFGHPWFLHAQAQIEGKDVCVISLHFDWQDCDLRLLQIRQVIEFASRYEYAVILGDFNPDDFVAGEKRSERLTYEEDLAPFRQAGFRVANADAQRLHDVWPSIPNLLCLTNLLPVSTLLPLRIFSILCGN